MGNYNVQSTHCTKATQKFEVNHRAKGTSIRLSVRPCDVSQVNCDPDFGKALLHTLLTYNGLHTDVRVRTVAIGYMTDTMGRMHSDAQFAEPSSVPAHVEMMGFLGIGNNPMVGCTVACVVDVATALNK